MANSTDPFGKATFGGGVPGGTTSGASTPAPAPLWKTYDQFFAGDPNAQKFSMYHTGDLPGGATSQMNWGDSGDPYRFAEQYNQYMAGQPQQYQDLANYGVTPDMVSSGQVKSIYQNGQINPIQVPNPSGSGTVAAGQGSGSTNSLDPSVLKKMWR